ncbi:MAG: hypothetical protein AB2L14_04870 [Candidatus Xenobiia bacterium LiM19]
MLLSAAEVETGAVGSLAAAVIETSRERVAVQELPKEVTTVEGRGEDGRFTTEFNRMVREGLAEGEADSRWDTDEAKRKRRDSRHLSLPTLSQGTLAYRLLSIGLIPMLSDRRGFDGLDGPKWALDAIVPTFYQPATPDKTLAEMALLDVGGALWQEHGKVWARWALEWSGSEGVTRWFVLYVDTTADPYWTYEYASSGRVSRVGKVMPCLSRAAVKLLSVLTARKNSHFITVLKGLAFRNLELEEAVGPNYPDCAIGSPKCNPVIRQHNW